MNKQRLVTAMKTSISEVLETMFFLPVDFSDAGNGSDQTLDDAHVLTTKLDFTGPCSGCFRLIIPEMLAQSISADFLGIDAGDLNAEDCAGTVKEMVNMLVGNTFSIYDANAVFDLLVPEMEEAGRTQNFKADQNNIIRVAVNSLESRMNFEVTLDNSPY